MQTGETLRVLRTHSPDKKKKKKQKVIIKLGSRTMYVVKDSATNDTRHTRNETVNRDEMVNQHNDNITSTTINNNDNCEEERIAIFNS